MVSKARDDFPEPDRPVNTMSWSRGSSRETSWRLCSRAPRMTRRSDTLGGYRSAETSRPASAGRSGRSQFSQLVAQEGGLLEAQLGCGSTHLGFHLVDHPDQLRRVGPRTGAGRGGQTGPDPHRPGALAGANFGTAAPGPGGRGILPPSESFQDVGDRLAHRGGVDAVFRVVGDLASTPAL